MRELPRGIYFKIRSGCHVDDRSNRSIDRFLLPGGLWYPTYIIPSASPLTLFSSSFGWIIPFYLSSKTLTMVLAPTIGRVCCCVLLLVRWAVLEVHASPTTTRFHSPSFLVAKRLGAFGHASTITNTNHHLGSTTDFSHVPFLTVHRGGATEDDGDDNDDESNNGGDDNDPSDVDDVLAAEDAAQQSTEPASTTAKDEIVLDDPTLDDEHADAYDENVEEEGEEEAVETSTTITTVASTDKDIPTTTTTDGKIPLVDTISPAMHDILTRQLKYRRREVQQMRPEIAAVIVAKELSRPPEGLPAHWLKENSSPEKVPSKRATVKSIVVSLLTVLVAVVGGTVVVSSSSTSSSSGTSTTPAILYEVPSVPKPNVPEPEQEEAAREPPEPSLLASPPATTTTKESPKEPQQQQEHEHSLRPGERPPREPIDETGLDKVLTRMEKALGNLFR